MASARGSPSAFDVHEAPTLTHRHAGRDRSVVDPLVLVVDDDEDTRTIYRTALEHLGYPAMVRGDGLAAVQAAREHRPDVVLMDVAMPRLDGLEAARCLKADRRTSACFVIAMTAYGDRDFERARGAGVDAFLCKPFNPFVLEEILGALRLPERDEVVKVCACGRSYTRSRWRELPSRGLMLGSELRNCPCGSTLALARRDLARAGRGAPSPAPR